MIWKHLARFGSLGFAAWNCLLLFAQRHPVAQFRSAIASLALIGGILWCVAAWRWRVSTDRQPMAFTVWLRHNLTDLIDVWRRR